MISLLRKAKIIFQEPVVIAATTSNKLDIDRTEGGAPAPAPALETLISIHGIRMSKVELGLWKKYTATFEDIMVNSMYLSKTPTCTSLGTVG